MDRILRQQKAASENNRGSPGYPALVSRPPSEVAGVLTPNLGRCQPNLESSNVKQLPPSTNIPQHTLKQKAGLSLQPVNSPPQVPATTRSIAQRPTKSSANVTPLSNIGKRKSLDTSLLVSNRAFSVQYRYGHQSLPPRVRQLITKPRRNASSQGVPRRRLLRYIGTGGRFKSSRWVPYTPTLVKILADWPG